MRNGDCGSRREVVKATITERGREAGREGKVCVPSENQCVRADDEQGNCRAGLENVLLNIVEALPGL